MNELNETLDTYFQQQLNKKVKFSANHSLLDFNTKVTLYEFTTFRYK